MISSNIEFKLMKNGNSIILPLEKSKYNLTPNYKILEDESINFVLSSPKPFSNPILWIQDAALAPTKAQKSINGTFEYYWHPSEENPLFLNHFGFSELMIELDEREYYYTVVDVLARKLNADNTQNILRYLESQISGLTNFCFSLTHQRADADTMGSASPQQIIQEVRLGVQSFIDVIPQYISRYRSRLTSAPKLVSWDEATNFAQRSIDYVLTHPDSLALSTDTTRSIRVGHRHYTTQAIEIDAINENTDIYENRVITGYLETCTITIGKIEQYYRDFVATLGKQEEPSNVPVGYQSILSIRKHFGTRYSEKILKECFDLQRGIAYCLDFVKKNLRVTRSVFGMPEATPGFLTSTHYRKTFERIVAFYRLGQLNVSGNQFLYNLRTLDKLYEFFCLYRLIESFEKIGFKLTRTEHSHMLKQTPIFFDLQPADSYTFGKNTSLVINLFYDRNIPSLPNKITVKEKNQSSRRPDYLIELSDGSSYAYIIFDAKYSSPRLAREVYLPALTMKYYHGLGLQNSAQSKCMGIFALHPQKNRSEISFFHKDAFNVFSNTPAFPALGTLSLDPDSEPSHLPNLLSRFITVFKRNLLE